MERGNGKFQEAPMLNSGYICECCFLELNYALPWNNLEKRVIKSHFLTIRFAVNTNSTVLICSPEDYAERR
jgi:hypothetical protein